MNDNVGKIRVNRTHGRTRLVGEEFNINNYITIEVVQGMVEEDSLMKKDIVHGTTRNILTVDMSARQWSEFVSSFGDGSGVTCTLSEIDGKRVAQNYITPNTIERSNHTIDANFESFQDEYNKISNNVQNILKKKSIGKQDKADILYMVNRLDNLSKDIIPLLRKRLREDTKKVISSAMIQFKNDVNEYENNNKELELDGFGTKK